MANANEITKEMVQVSRDKLWALVGKSSALLFVLYAAWSMFRHYYVVLHDPFVYGTYLDGMESFKRRASEMTGEPGQWVETGLALMACFILWHVLMLTAVMIFSPVRNIGRTKKPKPQFTYKVQAEPA